MAVLDSGVNPWHPHVGGLAGSVAFSRGEDSAADPIDRLGHGTAVCAAIHDKAPDAEIHVVKIFDRTLATSIRTLIRALDWATEHGMRLVNLSLGTPRPEHASPLADAVARARAAGTIIVAAREHEGRAWWPGRLDGVVGVVLDPDCPREAVRLQTHHAGTPVFRAAGFPRPIPGVPPERNLHGVSFAVANVTGMLARMLEDEPGIRDVASLAQAAFASHR